MEQFITNEQLQRISESEAKFILEHGEKQIRDILDTNKDIVARTITVLTIAVTILIALIGFSINRWEKRHEWDHLLVSATIGAFYLISITTLILKNLLPKNYYIMGAEPRDFFVDRVFNDANKSYRLTAIYVNEINECQKRITADKNNNEIRWKNLKHSLIMLFLVPLVLAATYIITTLFPLR
jgi:hypothetical protein